MNRYESDIYAARYLGTRARQEDYVAGGSLPGGVFLILADGMGGHADGNVASETAVHAAAAELGRSGDPRTAAMAANQALAEYKSAGKMDRSAGCTLIIATVIDGLCRWASIGDSYLLCQKAGQGVERINPLHTYGARLDAMVERGEISAEAAQSDPKRAALTSAVMGDEIEECSEGELTLACGDRLILASDGYLTMGQKQLEAFLLQHPATGRGDAEMIATTVLQTVKQAGRPKQDNTSVLVYELAPVQRKRHSLPWKSHSVAYGLVGSMCAGLLLLVGFVSALMMTDKDNAVAIATPPAVPKPQPTVAADSVAGAQAPNNETTPQPEVENTPKPASEQKSLEEEMLAVIKGTASWEGKHNDIRDKWRSCTDEESATAIAISVEWWKNKDGAPEDETCLNNFLNVINDIPRAPKDSILSALWGTSFRRDLLLPRMSDGMLKKMAKADDRTEDDKKIKEGIVITLWEGQTDDDAKKRLLDDWKDEDALLALLWEKKKDSHSLMLEKLSDDKLVELAKKNEQLTDAKVLISERWKRLNTADEKGALLDEWLTSGQRRLLRLLWDDSSSHNMILSKAMPTSKEPGKVSAFDSKWFGVLTQFKDDKGKFLAKGEAIRFLKDGIATQGTSYVDFPHKTVSNNKEEWVRLTIDTSHNKVIFNYLEKQKQKSKKGLSPSQEKAWENFRGKNAAAVELLGMELKK